jgi:hypothetical protein
MKKKTDELSVEELTRNEICAVENNDRIAKLEKEKLRDKKIISEYKEREKTTARALVLYERKIKWLKENLVSDVLAVCKKIESAKTEYSSICEKILNHEIRDEFSGFSGNLSLFEDNLYDICNKIEANAAITKSDRDFISNRVSASKKTEELDSNSRFDRLKQEFAQKIGESVNRKPGRPKKQDQSIVSEIGLGHKPENDIKTTDEIEDKLNSIFYSAPESKTTVSNIPKTSDSVFDFNEALNPNVSLKDIMADLMSDKEDDIKTYNSSEQMEEIKSAQQKSRIELIESGFIRNPVITKKPTEQKVIDQQQIKPTFEKRFLSIQDIVKQTNGETKK